MKKSALLVVLCMVLTVFLVGNVSAVESFEFNGTVKDLSGTSLLNALVNITIRDSTYTLIGSNSTTTNQSGWFNLTVSAPNGSFYKPVITFTNRTFREDVNFTEYVGKTLPSFPIIVYQRELITPTFYLRPAGTLRLEAVNGTSSNVSFFYQVKDTKIGYPIAEGFINKVNQINITVERDRNYSIMVYPDQSMPLSFNWNNFSTANSYSFAPGASSYNATTHVLVKQFNVTLRLDRISGYANYSGINGWDEFNIVPFLVEPGNQVHASYGDLPYNLSSAVGSGDYTNITSGFYNMSIPATVDVSNIILFASARNGTQYFGAFRNVSFTYGSAVTETTNFNFTQMSGLLGDASNITLSSLSGNSVNISTAKQTFILVNTTNSSLTNAYAHVEVEVNYTSYGGQGFTWMEDVQQDSAIASFSVILLNSSRVEEINAFASGGSTNFAPKRISPSIAEIQANSNITMKGFNPGGIDETIASGSITMSLYTSNSTCDVPNPVTSCLLGGTSENMSGFKPMNSVMGGGKISFRMGTGNISVHYVNVDMLASGPPDALFDSRTNESAGSSFDAVTRFGSGGPTIYDFILVSMPYDETAGSGLNDSDEINMSIPVMYDDNWNVIWNASTNGTNATALAQNDSHYEDKKHEWQNLLVSQACTTDVDVFNATTPCFVNTTENKIWIRLPHFSGTGPSVTGSVLASAASDSSSSSSSSSGGGGTTSSSAWTATKPGNDKELDEKGEVVVSLGSKQRVSLKVDGETHHVGVTKITSTSAVINISSDPQQATFNVGDVKKFDVTSDDYYDVQVTLNGINNKGTSSTVNISIVGIHELMPGSESESAPEEESIDAEVEENTEETVAEEVAETASEKKGAKKGWIIAITIILVLALVVGWQYWASGEQRHRIKKR